MNGQIAHRGSRQIELQRLPVIAGIVGEVHAGFGAGEQQALAPGIFANDTSNAHVRQAGHNFFPGFAGVAGSIEIGVKIATSKHRGVGRVCVVRRRFDAVDVRMIRQSRGSHVRPRRAIVRDVNQAGRRSDKEQVGIQRRRGQRLNRAVFGLLHVRIVVLLGNLGVFLGWDVTTRGRLGGSSLRFGCFGGQVATDFFPTCAIVGAL